MSIRVVLEATGLGLEAALLQDGVLVDLLSEDLLEQRVTDALFEAKVKSVDRGLNAAFLDIGTGVDALLAGKDARFAKGETERRPVQHLLHEGDSLIVQGVREAHEGKGARVTTDVRLFGYHMLWRPAGVGPELAKPARGAEREALRLRAEALFGGAAVALRKLAADVEDDVLRAEHEGLEARWKVLQGEAFGMRRPGRLQAGDQPVERLMRRLVEHSVREIFVADPGLLARVRAILQGPLVAHEIGLERLESDQTAFAQTGVDAALEAATGREVPLERGGRLVVEPTSACVAIDVDGEGRRPLDLDLDAAREIARILRLRNLGGTIIIDFVDLPHKNDRQRLEQTLTRAFRDDPAPVQILPMSPLGIVQISRARRGQSLDQLRRRPCPACVGSGTVQSLRGHAEDLLGAIKRQGGTSLRLAPDLAAWLEKEAGAVWKQASTGLAVSRDSTLGPEGWRLEQPARG